MGCSGLQAHRVCSSAMPRRAVGASGQAASCCCRRWRSCSAAADAAADAAAWYASRRLAAASASRARCSSACGSKANPGQGPGFQGAGAVHPASTSCIRCSFACAARRAPQQVNRAEHRACVTKQLAQRAMSHWCASQLMCTVKPTSLCQHRSAWPSISASTTTKNEPLPDCAPERAQTLGGLACAAVRQSAACPSPPQSASRLRLARLSAAGLLRA